MDGAALPGHPGWTVRLPFDRDEVLKNADVMGNCTGYYHESIHQGSEFLLIIDGPRGEQCNVGLARRHDPLDIVELKDRFNAPAPHWMDVAVRAMMAASQRPQYRPAIAVAPDDAALSEPPLRQPKPRRRPGGGLRRRPSSRPPGCRAA